MNLNLSKINTTTHCDISENTNCKVVTTTRELYPIISQSERFSVSPSPTIFPAGRIPISIPSRKRPIPIITITAPIRNWTNELVGALTRVSCRIIMTNNQRGNCLDGFQRYFFQQFQQWRRSVLLRNTNGILTTRNLSGQMGRNLTLCLLTAKDI